MRSSSWFFSSGTFVLAAATALVSACDAPSVTGPSSSVTSALAAGGIPVYEWQNATHVFPATLAAQPSANYDANNCELWVSDIGNGNTSVDGATDDWIEVSIATNPQQSGQILEVGMFTETTDGAETITLGSSTAAASYETGYTYTRIEPGTPSATVQETVSDFAFFVDVKRDDGTVVRLWQSDAGRNYDFSAVFAGPPGHVESGGDTTVDYANPDSYAFWQKDACAS